MNDRERLMRGGTMEKTKRGEMICRVVTPGVGTLEGHDDRATTKRAMSLGTKLRVEQALSRATEWEAVERELAEEQEKKIDELLDDELDLPTREEMKDLEPETKEDKLIKKVALETAEAVWQQVEGLPCEVPGCGGKITPDKVPAHGDVSAHCSECDGEFEWQTGESE